MQFQTGHTFSLFGDDFESVATEKSYSAKRVRLLGDSDTHIDPVDSQGVALASIQEKDQKIDALQQQLDALGQA